MTEEQDKRLYQRVIEGVFANHYKPGVTEFLFDREELAESAVAAGMDPSKNHGAIVYQYRFRSRLPQSIRDTESEGLVWSIRLAGPARYRFALGPSPIVKPNELLRKVKVPDTTPEIVKRYAKGDEQALLARIRYCRLLDIFLQVASFSLQSHLRTAVPDVGQIEIDEVYVAVDRRGAHYFIPLQAKSGRDKLSLLQTEQDMAFARERLPEVICRPVSAQFMRDGTVALFEMAEDTTGVAVVREAHYSLVPHGEITADDLKAYGATAE